MVILAAASMTIVTYGKDENIVNQLYGIVLLPVSVAFMFYAAWQYLRRSYMIKNHTPGKSAFVYSFYRVNYVFNTKSR